MSFTIMRYKDGKKMPIKVSILDAFRSAPPRRPKAAKLVQVEEKKPDNMPAPDNKPSLAKVGSPKVTNSNGAHENGNNMKNFSNREEETYTAEDDAKIIAMKDEKKTWRDIKEAIGKESESQLKNHYRLYLGPNAQEERNKQAERTARAEKNKAEGLAKQAEGQGKQGDEGGGVGDGGDDGEKKNGVGGGNGERKNGVSGDNGEQKKVGGGGGDGKNKGKEKARAKAQEESKPENDTPEALTRQNLKAFVAKYEREKWLAAASRHYDLTGHRISPETAKKMLKGD